MQAWMRWLVGGVVLGIGALAALSLSQGQERPAPPPAVAAPAGKEPAPPAQTSPKLSQLSPLRRQLYLSAGRGADWLYRANRSDGRFVPGHLPALKVVLDGDHYSRQIEAAIALARAARLSQNQRHLARARQAVLTLFLDTALDPQDSRVRQTTHPAAVVNRLGAAGLLVLAVHELPAPGNDLLDQAEQLCAFIARRQRPDGSLRSFENTEDPKQDVDAAEFSLLYPGQALAGLMASQRTRPAPWKIEAARKALTFYRAGWKTHRSMDPVPWLTAAFAEAYLQTKDKACADYVFEMSDWICDLQYAHLDPQHPLWLGGFMGFEAGKPAVVEPQAASALVAAGLVEACRAARQLGDVQRYGRYGAAVRGCLQFLTTLQFTESNTTHYADWYKPVLLGGFHPTHQDGNLRIDYTAQAVSALVQYLAYVPE